MKIVGTSGVSILLAGQVMLRHEPKVCITDPEPKNNHTAVLRFKSDKIFKFLNIPCTQVTIDKGIWYQGTFMTDSNLQLQNMYSQKVTGNVLDRSIRDMSSEIRYIAPDNFFDLLKIGLNIEYGCDWKKELFDGTEEPKLNYIKMPMMMDHLGVDHHMVEFKSNPVTTINAKIVSPEIDVYQTIYFPDPDLQVYRASITKDELIIELIGLYEETEEQRRDLVDWILSDVFKLIDARVDSISQNLMPTGKMAPIADSIRKSFIAKLTNEYNIYSFGRAGIWKSIRLDTLFDDLMKIDKMIRSDKYYARLDRAN
jgi:hypothetical protein